MLTLCGVLLRGRLVEAQVAAAPHHRDEATSLLLDLTERLLDAHAAALAAFAGAPSVARAQLQAAYEQQRQELLQATLDEAVRLRAAGELSAHILHRSRSRNFCVCLQLSHASIADTSPIIGGHRTGLSASSVVLRPDALRLGAGHRLSCHQHCSNVRLCWPLQGQHGQTMHD